eukprot:CAMPEP_0194035372 /NCGR_PEP_ID=MMETSP0009_2-20130614/7793_1 /TAXON_ID=210454 /ORGANISM="Grammatophora oceanica, Strain CCMP 410" /LENGTH=390 /DNA_ID=CAMNT_0038676697 /DNA_START=113 /DNA_END=1285 /DNA_ORIENTATION=-
MCTLKSTAVDADIATRTEQMDKRASDGAALTENELEDIISSLKNLVPADALKWDELQTLLRDVAHLSHKDWQRTGDNSEKLSKLLLPGGMDEMGRQMLDRVVKEGNWDGAADHKKSFPEDAWAVLVTGVNGIRKTTSIYQPWFPDLLKEALVVPNTKTAKPEFETNILPQGTNAFFRQLDHMIATLCNEDFAELYKLTQDELGADVTPSKEVIQKYSNLKAAIFTRYRTLSELLGAALLREAQAQGNLNCMLETSGRDVAMFHYVDHFFPAGYHKLALHFTINDLSEAQKSVDARMVQEMKDGIVALKDKDSDILKIIYANAGGPYGSEVLAGVQEASDRVWETEVMSGNVGSDWYKASIVINAHPTEPWTAQAVKPDGTLGTKFSFEKR